MNKLCMLASAALLILTAGSVLAAKKGKVPTAAPAAVEKSVIEVKPSVPDAPDKIQPVKNLAGSLSGKCFVYPTEKTCFNRDGTYTYQAAGKSPETGKWFASATEELLMPVVQIVFDPLPGGDGTKDIRVDLYDLPHSTQYALYVSWGQNPEGHKFTVSSEGAAN